MRGTRRQKVVENIKFGRRRNWNGINKKTITTFEACDPLNIKYILETFHAIIKHTKRKWDDRRTIVNNNERNKMNLLRSIVRIHFVETFLTIIF